MYYFPLHRGSLTLSNLVVSYWIRFISGLPSDWYSCELCFSLCSRLIWNFSRCWFPFQSAMHWAMWWAMFLSLQLQFRSLTPSRVILCKEFQVLNFRRCSSESVRSSYTLQFKNTAIFFNRQLISLNRNGLCHSCISLGQLTELFFWCRGQESRNVHWSCHGLFSISVIIEE